MMLKGKRVRLDQLQREAEAAGITLDNGLAQWGDFLGAPDVDGVPREVPDGMQAVVDAHVPMRDITNDELQAQFLTAYLANDTATVDHINQQVQGVIPRDQVPE